MADVGELGSCVYGDFEKVDGRLYSVARVKTIVGVKQPKLEPVMERPGFLARRVYDDGTFGEDVFWLLDQVPEGYGDKGIASYLTAADDAERADLAELKQRREEWALRYPMAKTDVEGARLCEPTYFTRPDGIEVGIFRDDSRGFRLYSAVRDQETDNWSLAKKTNIPDSPSKTVSGVLPDGSVFIVGNFFDKLWMRDPLLLARSKDGIHFDEAHVLRAGASQPTERNQFDRKGPGFQYPNAVVTEDSLWVTYSISKEQIAISRIPLTVFGQ
jgi:hypothetical protein